MNQYGLYDGYRAVIRQWLPELEDLSVLSGEPQSATAFVCGAVTDVVDTYTHHPFIVDVGQSVIFLQLSGDEIDVGEIGQLRYTIGNPSSAMVARHMCVLLQELDILTVGVREDAGRFRVTVVIEETDLDLWERIFQRTAEIYDVFPDLRAEIIVVDRQDPEGQVVLTGDGVDCAVVP